MLSMFWTFWVSNTSTIFLSHVHIEESLEKRNVKITLIVSQRISRFFSFIEFLRDISIAPLSELRDEISQVLTFDANRLRNGLHERTTNAGQCDRAEQMTAIHQFTNGSQIAMGI